MAVNLGERNSAREFDAEHDHSGDPEEENVPACLKEGGRVESFEILGLRTNNV